MLTVQNDWIQYETVPVRRAAVRGGAACAQRIPVRREVAPRPVVTVQERTMRVAAAQAAPRNAPRRSRLRLTRRGRFVLLVLPGLLAASGAFAAVAVPAAGSSPAPAATHAPLAASHG